LIARAGEIARRSGARVTVFHSLYSPFLTGQQYFSEEELRQTIADAVEARKAELEVIAQPLRAAGIDVHVRVRWDYPPHESIVREVLREKIGLLFEKFGMLLEIVNDRFRCHVGTLTLCDAALIVLVVKVRFRR